jgi:hypothetical protein
MTVGGVLQHVEPGEQSGASSHVATAVGAHSPPGVFTHAPPSSPQHTS